MPYELERAPVDDVGGTQDTGPWPTNLEEIAVDDRLQRPVRLEDGTTEVREIVITDVQQIIRDDGTPTDGYVVAHQYGGEE